MSEENVEIVSRVFELVNARDFEAVVDAQADDVVLTLHGGFRALAGGGHAVGKKAVVEWFGDWFRTFDPAYSFEIEEVRDLGDRVLVVATHHARGRVSGAPINSRGAWVWTVRGRKIVRIDAFGSREDALEAAGLSE
jgi:ketosteroid isomerase-like protein